MAQGEFRNGRRHGEGESRNAAGQVVFKGSFCADKFHGSGTYVYPAGDVYEGEFANGKFHGFGTYTFEGGDTASGLFLNGKLATEGLRP